MEEKDIVLNHLKDLAARRDNGNYCLFSHFLSPDILPDAKGVGNICFFGGYDDAERCMAALYPDYMDKAEIQWPISALLIVPADGKRYTHRDYLGTLMSLGIKRQVLGDIVAREKDAVLFCDDTIKEFILMNLTRLAGTSVMVRELADEEELPTREYEKVCGSVASERLDCVVAFICKTSRNNAAEIISSGRVLVNYKEQTGVSAGIKPGDRITVRGLGKYIYDGQEKVTKKGRLIVALRKYI